jgi:hypothetical protein
MIRAAALAMVPILTACVLTSTTEPSASGADPGHADLKTGRERPRPPSPRQQAVETLLLDEGLTHFERVTDEKQLPQRVRERMDDARKEDDAAKRTFITLEGKVNGEEVYALYIAFWRQVADGWDPRSNEPRPDQERAELRVYTRLDIIGWEGAVETKFLVYGPQLEPRPGFHIADQRVIVSPFLDPDADSPRGKRTKQRGFVPAYPKLAEFEALGQVARDCAYCCEREGSSRVASSWERLGYCKCASKGSQFDCTNP